MAYDDIDFAIPLTWWSDPIHQQRLKGAITKRGYRYRWQFGAFGTPGRFGYEESWTKDPKQQHMVKVDLFSIVEKNSSYIWSLWTRGDKKKRLRGRVKFIVNKWSMPSGIAPTTTQSLS